MAEDLFHLFPEGKRWRILGVLIICGIVLFISATLVVLCTFPNSYAAFAFFKESDPNVIREKIIYFVAMLIVM